MAGCADLADDTVDLALINGRFWTGRPSMPMTDALGINGAYITALGNDAVRSKITVKTQVIDLDGACAIPAFIDSHTHFLKAAVALLQPDLLSVKNKSEFVARIAAVAKRNPGAWILGQSWDEYRMGGELPSRDWIDAVTPDTPVAVPRTDLHLVLANSKALALAGIDKNTPDPAGGEIVRDADGVPTGILKDNAKSLIDRVIPPYTAAQEDAALAKAIDLCHANGVAQVHIPEIDWNAHNALRRTPLAREKGLRFYSMVPIEGWPHITQTIAEEGRGDDWVRWGAVKALADGSLGSRTALFYEPYQDDPSTSGIRIMGRNALEEAVIGADAAGLQVCIHAIGDRANDDALDIFQSAADINGPRDRRFRIEHAQHLKPETIPRFASQNVIASVQPYHAIDDGRWAESRIGTARLNGTYAFASLIKSGARVAFGSDWPVAPINPLTGIYAAVTRQTIDGANPGGWIPDQKITAEQALHAYTVENAFAGFQDAVTGVLAPGYFADITVLDRDITRLDGEQIKFVNVLKTIVGGTVRYSA
ncbi:MAG: amidohydrolase [Pseudomonadota bacterium]